MAGIYVYDVYGVTSVIAQWRLVAFPQCHALVSWQRADAACTHVWTDQREGALRAATLCRPFRPLLRLLLLLLLRFLPLRLKAFVTGPAGLRHGVRGGGGRPARVPHCPRGEHLEAKHRQQCR